MYNNKCAVTCCIIVIHAKRTISFVKVSDDAATTYYFVKTLKDSHKTNSCCCCLPAAHTTQTQLIILCYYIFCKILSLSAAAAAKVTRDAFWPGELMQHSVTRVVCVCVFVFNIKKPTLLYWRRWRRPTI